MKQELQQQLFEKYPELFTQHALGPMVSPMGRGLECGDGWFYIIDTMCWCLVRRKRDLVSRIESGKKYDWDFLPKIEAELAACPDPPTFAQIKEKFGTLRVYIDGGDAVSEAVIAFAESMSAVTCEECGERGEVRDGSWIRTLCDSCHEQRLETARKAEEAGQAKKALTAQK